MNAEPPIAEESSKPDYFRLGAVFLLIIAAGVLIWWFAGTHDPIGNLAGIVPPGADPFEGLNPNVLACYTFRGQLTTVAIACAYGLAIGTAYIFGTFLYKKFRDSSVRERQAFWNKVADRMQSVTGHELNEAMNNFREYERLILDRRNLFWVLYLRAVLAIMVVATVALLIASCKVEAQAGLPIITGVVAFIIGQGANAVGAGGGQMLVVVEGGPSGSKPREGRDEGPGARPDSGEV